MYCPFTIQPLRRLLLPISLSIRCLHGRVANFFDSSVETRSLCSAEVQRSRIRDQRSKINSSYRRQTLLRVDVVLDEIDDRIEGLLVNRVFPRNCPIDDEVFDLQNISVFSTLGERSIQLSISP